MKQIIPKKPNLILLVLGLLLWSFSAQAQKEVSGRVTDENGEGIPGATIQIKGTTTGTVTDFDGNYTLSVTEGSTLVISSIGYEPIEVVVGNQTVIDINMSEQIEELNEVVVIGYGAVQKKDLTGVVAKVNAKDFNKGMLASPDQLLAGKVAGVQISQTGEPGGNANIRIRGGSTFTQGAGAEPLFVVDGIPLNKNSSHRPEESGRNPLNFINPADIESITVLKDASASAIYGVQAGSGVIIITTKSGGAGKLKLVYDGSVSVSALAGDRDVLSTEEYRFGIERRAPQYVPVLGDADTDWVDEVTRTAVSTNHGLTATWGGKTNSFRASANYQNLNGVLLNSNAEKITGSIKYNQKLFQDRFNITLSNTTTVSRDRLSDASQLNAAYTFDPTQPVRVQSDTANGNFFEWGNALAPGNPVSQLEQVLNQNRAVRHFTTLQLSYDLPIEGLTANLNLGYDKLDSRRQRYNPITLNPIANQDGDLFFEDGDVTTRTFEAFLNYKTSIGKHKFDFVVGNSGQDFRGRYAQFRILDGIPLEDVRLNDPENVQSLDFYQERTELFQNNGNDIRRVPLNRLASVYGRLNYTFNEKYLLTATLRADASSRFPEESSTAYFPSAALAWRIIDEPFMQGTNLFSDLKLRVGVGSIGNQEASTNFPYLDIYSESTQTAQYILGSDTVNLLRPTGNNRGVVWEVTTTYNAGVDFGFLDGRINGSLDVYRKVTEDLLLDVTFPIGVLPADRAFANVGGFTVNGAELLLNAYVIDQGDFSWDLSFNAAYNRGEVDAIGFFRGQNDFGIQQTNISGDVGQTAQVLREGEEPYAFLVYEHRMIGGRPVTDGEDINGDGLENDLDRFIDQNGDGVINENDLIAYESPAPDVILGLTSNLRYRNWDLAFTLRSQLGLHVYNNFNSVNGWYDETLAGVPVPSNPHRSAFENDFNERGSRGLLSSIYVEQADFLKLDNITVGYTFKNLEKIKPRVYFTASNLFVLTKYSGPDPEAGGIFGVDNNRFPFSRMFILGINATLN